MAIKAKIYRHQIILTKDVRGGGLTWLQARACTTNKIHQIWGTKHNKANLKNFKKNKK